MITTALKAEIPAMPSALLDDLFELRCGFRRLYNNTVNHIFTEHSLRGTPLGKSIKDKRRHQKRRGDSAKIYEMLFFFSLAP